MRLRRLELIVMGLTLAFACFIGGYFVGRNTGTVSISPAVTRQNEAPQSPGAAATAPQGQGQAGDPQGGGAGAQAGGAQGAGAAQGGAAAQGGDAAQAGGGAQSGGAAQAAETAPPARDGDGRININLASRSELMDLPGIGATLSERIVDYRSLHGPFSRIEDIRNVSGIGEKRYETIKDRITVGG